MQINKKFWQIKNEAGSDRAEILLYGEINANAEFWKEWLGDDSMTSARGFAQDLQSLEGKDLLLRINSPGGDVFQAQAMYSLLKSYSGDVECHIDGICASAATVVACAANKIVMPENALFMIHNPSVMLCDSMTEDDLQKVQGMLAKVKESILSAYLARTDGKSDEQDIKDMMDNESWLTAQEAQEKGFIDEVDDFGVAASLTDSAVLVVNGQAMPGIVSHKEEILEKLNAGKKVRNNMAVNKSLMEQIKAFFGTADGKEVLNAVSEAKEAEKNRVAALDALKGENEYVNALVDVAKAQGQNAEALKPYVEAVAKVQPKNTALEQMAALIKDEMQSGAQGVKAQPAEAAPQNQEKAKKQAEIDKIVNLANGLATRKEG